MKIIVFGATGGVGQYVVKQALEKGIEVTAFVRTPSEIEVVHEQLHIMQGDAFNKDEVAAAIAGHDAVVSCLGSSQGMKKSTELEEMNNTKTHLSVLLNKSNQRSIEESQTEISICGPRDSFTDPNSFRAIFTTYLVGFATLFPGFFYSWTLFMKDKRHLQQAEDTEK